MRVTVTAMATTAVVTAAMTRGGRVRSDLEGVKGSLGMASRAASARLLSLAGSEKSIMNRCIGVAACKVPSCCYYSRVWFVYDKLAIRPMRARCVGTCAHVECDTGSHDLNGCQKRVLHAGIVQSKLDSYNLGT